jgi:signal transduction histidine kinase
MKATPAYPANPAMHKPIVSARTRPTLFVVFLAAFSAVLVLSNLALYRRARGHLDGQLGERLRAIATAVAHEVEDTRPDSLTAGTIDPLLYDQLLIARDDHQLSNIVIMSAGGNTAIDLAGYSEPGDENPYIQLDVTAVALARAGVPAYTNLYRTGDVYLKSAYAPIHSPAGAIIGIAGVEAGASFFAQLRELRDLIVLISLGNASVVILLGFLFYRRTRSLERAREVMIEKDNLAALGRMVATIAHEIRNPLSIIRASAERVRRRHALDDEALTYIIDEVDGLDRVLTGYLQFAKSQPAAFVSLDVGQILRRALLAVEDQAAARHVNLRVQDGGGLALRGDERRVRQAVLNVLLNALEVTPEGGTISVEVARGTGHVAIAISDNGPGIDPSILRDVTRPFFTTRVDGSGLGLTVVQSVMEEHGGGLSIEPAPGGGTRVVLSFPQNPESAAAAKE